MSVKLKLGEAEVARLALQGEVERTSARTPYERAVREVLAEVDRQILATEAASTPN